MASGWQIGLKETIAQTPAANLEEETAGWGGGASCTSTSAQHAFPSLPRNLAAHPADAMALDCPLQGQGSIGTLTGELGRSHGACRERENSWQNTHSFFVPGPAAKGAPRHREREMLSSSHASACLFERGRHIMHTSNSPGTVRTEGRWQSTRGQQRTRVDALGSAPPRRPQKNKRCTCGGGAGANPASSSLHTCNTTSLLQI